ncbi:hypothetical protein [Demequina aurantiaca]|uniref:hypothetical protein n=1 Tax=Demequina aurantiaca TaxID=676200 RepID=UPI003D33EB75
MTYQGVTPQTAPQRTSSSAIIGLVFALLGIIPLGLAFSIGGLLQTSGGDRSGRGIAIAGLSITVVQIALLLSWYFFIRA